jgi:hypothetical protein
MVGDVLRLTAIAVLLAGLVLAVPSAAQVGGGKILFTAADGVYTVNPDGSELAQVHGPCPRGNGCWSPAWSPDGSQFAFLDDNQLKVMAADGTGERTLYTTILEPYGESLGGQAWSPDGQSITFRSSGGVLVVTLDGTATWVASGAGPPAWSPDGSKIAFYRAGLHAYELLLVDPIGGVPILIASASRMTAPVWSPDSRMLTFAGGLELGGGGGGLYVVDADGTDLRQVAGGGTAAPEWAPDGTRIAFTKTVGYYDGYPYRDIHVVGVDGTGEERLTHALITAGPSWAPDGKQIVFSRNGTPVTMNSDGGCQSRLVAGVSSSWETRWQPFPKGPSAGRKECHSLTVRATGTPTNHGTAAVVRVTFRNSGTRPLTHVEFVPPRPSDMTATSARTSRGRCVTRRVLIRCTLGTLAPGKEAHVVIRADGRRVGPRDEGNAYSLSMPLVGRAAERSIDPESAVFDFRIFLPRCTTHTPGGGTIVGTRDPEHICGRRGPDRINGKGGGDRIDAGAGRDVVFSRNVRRDFIRCGPGDDTVVADRMDAVARNCEHVRQR